MLFKAGSDFQMVFRFPRASRAARHPPGASELPRTPEVGQLALRLPSPKTLPRIRRKSSPNVSLL